MNDTTQPNKKTLFSWRNRRRILMGLAVFATIIAVFYAEENWRGRRAWENCKHEWEAKGERLDWQSIVPPHVPDDQNFALTPVVCSSYGQLLTRDGKAIPPEKRDTNLVNRLDMDIYFGIPYSLQPANGFGSWVRGVKSDLKIWQQFYRSAANPTNGIKTTPQPQTPAADVLLALSKYDSTIEELRAAARLPYSRFPVDYDTDCPAAILLPHLGALRKSSLVLSLRISAELQNDQSEKALADVELSFRLIDSIRNEPSLISHLVRMAILQITLNPIYEGLAEHRWSDAQLVTLGDKLQKIDFLTDFQTAMHSERVWDVADVDWVHRSDNKSFSSMLGYSHSAGLWPMLKCAPSGWLEQNKVWLCNLYTNLNTAANLNNRTMQPAAAGQCDLKLEHECSHITPYNFLVRILMPALGSAAKRFAYAQATTDLARAACALERYRLARGEYPEALAALGPQFIAQVPHDVIGGQPLHYRRTKDGKFLLYSVGWNETDDGGSLGTLADVKKGDWVWQYPLE